MLEYFEDNRLELYNLREDVGEKENVASKFPARAEELHSKLVAWRKSINAPMPTKNIAPSKTESDPKPRKKRNRE